MSSLSGLSLVAFFVTLSLVLAVSVPFTGTLVRFRASYNPRGLALDAEGGAQPHTGPVVNSYFGMMSRVYRIEGWAGLYKGTMPTVISALIISLFAILFLDVSGPSRSKYGTPDGGIFATFFYSVFYTFVSLPAMIITYRAIITPYRLPAFNPVIALRILLTATERSRPWILYLTPGLLGSQILHIAYVVIILNVAGRAIFKAPEEWNDADLWRVGAYIFLTLVSTIVLTPLEVVSTRLAIQRNHASADLNSVNQDVDAPEELVDYYGDSEDVIGLRSDRDPYLGLIDCAKRIIDEEGIRALYRGWWVTALAGLAKA